MLFSKYKCHLSGVSFILFVTVLAATLHFFHEQTFYSLRYQREQVLSGEWWRLFSGHIVHVSGAHVLINLSAIVLLWFLFKDILLGYMWWWLILAGMLGVSFGLFVFSPEISWFAGLSGVLHSVYTGGAIIFFRRSLMSGGLLLGVVITKILWEQYYGALPGSADITGARVIVVSHLYGTLSGFIVALIIMRNSAVKK